MTFDIIIIEQTFIAIFQKGIVYLNDGKMHIHTFRCFWAYKWSENVEKYGEKLEERKSEMREIEINTGTFFRPQGRESKRVKVAGVELSGS